MAGLSNLIANTETKATTLPTWMNQAQQNVVNMATTGAAQVPQLQNTVANQAINTYGGANNPFSQAQNTLSGIASGAANPWITNATTGAVTPNTNTALGGLFQAQNQQLQQIMPQFTAPVDASAIGSGNFGSLRGDTAYNKAMGDAQANLFAQQNQAALQNQQTGVQAGTAIGNLGAQDITGAKTLTDIQQTAPLSSAANLSKIIGGLNVPESVTSSATISPLNQIGALTSALGGGTNAVNSLLNSIKPGTNIGSLLGGLFSGGGGGTGTPAQEFGTDQSTIDYLNNNPGVAPRDDDGNLMPGWQSNSDGSVSWSGNTDAGGTPAYDVPDGWGADETYY